MTQLTTVPADDLDLVWPHIETLVERATASSHGRETAFDIRRSIRARDCQLWMAWNDGPEAICITQIEDHPRKKVCRIRIAVGENMAAWVEYMRDLTAWAKAVGCSGIIAEARPGWERVLRPYGFEKTHVLLEHHFED